MAHDTKILVDGLVCREREYAAAMERIDAFVEGDTVARPASGDLRILREAIELCRCLRRIVPVASANEIHKAFGAPGDFGYETPIGDALARFYRGTP